MRDMRRASGQNWEMANRNASERDTNKYKISFTFPSKRMDGYFAAYIPSKLRLKKYLE